jgi:hypothetical protein
VLHCYGSNWEDGMSTAVVRIDEHMLAGVKQIAAMRGTTPGDMLVRAWEEFVERHREEIASDFDHVAQAFRAGDREAVLDFMQKTRSARAEAAEARAAG